MQRKRNVFHSQCRSRMGAVTHQILNLNCVLSQMAINGTCEATLTRPQNSYPLLARGLEGFNIPHLGRIVHHAVQTPQNVPLATASTAKSCHAFFNLLSLHRSFAVKHAGFDCMKKVKHSSSNRSTHPYAGVCNTQSPSHLTTSEQSSCRVCASRSCHP